MEMENDIERVFAEQILALLEKKKFVFKTYIQTGRDDKGFHAEVAVKNTDVAIRIEKKKRSENHTEIDPDPRMFGDTAEVTANAMRDWYPGKTNSWTTTTTTVIIEATGLPEIDTHKETYEYTDHSWRDNTQKAVENILELVERRYREIEHEKEQANLADQAQQIKNAFAKIK
jgi:hypothetical protein